MERQILKHPDEVAAWFKDCPEVLAFDWETSGLNYLKMEPVGISFCDGERSCYVDLWENKYKHKIIVLLCDILQGRLLVAHNLKFDFKCLWKWLIDFNPGRLFCTYIASFLLDENKSSHSLDALAEEYFGVGKAGKWNEYSNWHSDEFYEYAIRDAELCWRLYSILEPRLREEELEQVFDIEMDFIPVAAEIEMNGILIDQAALAELQATVESKILESENNLLALVGKEARIEIGLYGQEYRSVPINFGSPKQLIECFTQLGLPIKDKTPGGQPSVAKSTLESLKGNPFVDELVQYKRLQKLYSGYIIPCWEMIDEDGRIRPSVGIVKTGRTSMSNPNLQQLPNVKDSNINYRKIFSTRGQLIGADYSGQELRILGEITQDENILQSFHNNYDLHLLTAKHIFDLKLTEKNLKNGTAEHYQASEVTYKSERYKAKNGANFPIVFGASAGGIAWRQGVSKDEAQKWVDGFFRAYPRVREAMENIPQRLYSKGWVETLMGRKRRFPNYRELSQFSKGKRPSKDRCVRQAFNFMIQGFAADQAKIAGRKIYDQLKAHPEWKARILLIVHDEWVLECLEEKYIETVKQCVINCMENAVCLSVPFKVECKIGNNYAEIK